MASQIQSSRHFSILEIKKGQSFLINIFHKTRASSIKLTSFPYPMKSFQIRRSNQEIAFALDTGSSSIKLTSFPYSMKSFQIRRSNQEIAFALDKGSSSIKLTSFPYSMKSFQIKRSNKKIAFALDTGSSSVPGDNGGGEQEINGDRTGLGSTRLGRIAIAGGKQLLLKLNSARKNFPMKIFLLLLGFYTANALATILGQTGDWDVLVAGIVVAAIEGIGMLMYKKPSSSMFSGKFQSFVVFMNFWKAGVCLGLFVDAFKLGS